MKTMYVLGLLFVFSVLIVSPIVLSQETRSEDAEVEKLNLNVATLDELKAVTGMTPEIAQAIVENRPYQKIENLLELSGMTEEILATMKDGICVEKININTAPISELKLLPGMTPEMAEAIVEGRPYQIVEELLKIKGMNEELLTHLQGFVATTPEESQEEADQKGWKTRQQNFPVASTPSP